jgi:membrane associated rhomboid family serine protease
MGEADRYQEYKGKQAKRFKISFGDDGNALMNIVVLNVVFFLILLVIQVAVLMDNQGLEVFYAQVLRWFALPASFTKFTERPWTIITYMFSDSGTEVIRALSNMLWLWAFGYLLQQMAGNDKLIPIYIYGGVLGGIFFMAANYFIPTLRPTINDTALLGANAATVAVAMATTTLSPKYKFFSMIRGGISIWVLMAAYLIIDLAGVASSGAAYSLAHIGGAIAGFLFVVFLRKGRDGSVWMNKFYFWFINLFNPNSKGHSTAPKDKFYYNTGSREPFTKTANITQQRVDEILDKINTKGYHFLTDEEKGILKKASEDENL